MNSIRIRTQLDSTTLHLPELSTLLGKTVEIVVVESAPSSGVNFSLAEGPGHDLLADALAETGALSRLA